jgi:surface protein
MPTLNYSFEELWGNNGEGTSSINLTAGTTYTFPITSSIGAGYLTLETVRNYDGVTPKNTSGSYTALTNIASSVISDYIAGFSVPQGFSSFVYTPASNVVGSTLKLRGVGGVILGSGSNAPTPPINASFKIDTTQTSGTTTPSNQFQLPLLNVTMNFTIDWGDGTTDTITSSTQAETLHTYTTPGEYYISITSGVLKGWQFATSTDAIKLIEIFDWSVWEITNPSSFVGCSNLVSNATSVPTITTTNLNGTFAGCTNFNGPLNNWNLSGVLETRQMFQNASSFNQPLDNWDVSGVGDMQLMFFGATAFDQNIGSWDISNVAIFINFMSTKTPSTFSTTNLNAIYNGWSLLTVQPNLTISFGTAKYTSAGAAGRAILDNAPNNWTITDGGQV